MARRKKRRTKLPARRPRKNNPSPRRGRGRRTARSLATSMEGKILIATLGMQIIAMIVKNLTKTFKIAWLPPQFIVPGLIYFLARQKIIPIEGLEIVAFTKLADNFWNLLGIDYSGTYAGTYAGNSAYPQQFDYQAPPRSPQQTAAALIAAQNKSYGWSKPMAFTGAGQASLQVGRKLASRSYQGTGQQSLQTGRLMAAKRYSN